MGGEGGRGKWRGSGQEGVSLRTGCHFHSSGRSLFQSLKRFVCVTLSCSSFFLVSFLFYYLSVFSSSALLSTTLIFPPVYPFSFHTSSPFTSFSLLSFFLTVFLISNFFSFLFSTFIYSPLPFYHLLLLLFFSIISLFISLLTQLLLFLLFVFILLFLGILILLFLLLCLLVPLSSPFLFQAHRERYEQTDR